MFLRSGSHLECICWQILFSPQNVHARRLVSHFLGDVVSFIWLINNMYTIMKYTCSSKKIDLEVDIQFSLKTSNQSIII